jgi:V-type H+-transporting ATPase subunit C
VKEYVPPAPEAADAPPTSLSLIQLKAEGEAKQRALETWARTAYGEAFSCYVHLAVIRLFVESILRYGLPPQVCCEIGVQGLSHHLHVAFIRGFS